MFETLVKSLGVKLGPSTGTRYKLNNIFHSKYFRVTQTDSDGDYCSFMLPRVYENGKCVSEQEMIEYSPISLKPLEQDCECLDTVIDKFVHVTSLNRTRKVSLQR